MTHQNNAAQPVLTDDDIKAIRDRMGGGFLGPVPFARAIESAVLSRLRAPVAQPDERVRKALHTLVNMYVLNQGSDHEHITCYSPLPSSNLTAKQRAKSETWKAWDEARAALASAPAPQPEWIDDPHDIEQGMMRNPKYVPPVAGEAQQAVAVVRDNPEEYGTLIDALVALPVGTQLFAAPQASAMPTLNDAMRAVISNERDVYQTPEALYAALCDAALDAHKEQP